MFGLSSVWKSAKTKDGFQILNEYEKIGVPGIELEYRITAEMFEQVKKGIRSSSLQILSLHNYCPHPEILPLEKRSGDALMLTATDKNERKLAVKYSKRTIQNAADLEAKAVVFHIGRILGMEREEEQWFALLEKSKFKDSEGQKFFNQTMRKREQVKQPYFDAVLKSLDELNEEAIKRGIELGIENRYYWDEFPNIDEVEVILNYFRGGNLGYWHDVGHAQAHETYGLTTHEEFLKRYAGQLIGCHLHDCKEAGYRDHFAPGTGWINYDMIQKYLPENAIRIIEVHPKVTAGELRDGIQFFVYIILKRDHISLEKYTTFY